MFYESIPDLFICVKEALNDVLYLMIDKPNIVLFIRTDIITIYKQCKTEVN